MSRRCCCGCPSGTIRFRDGFALYYDDQGDEVDVSEIEQDSDGNLKLPTDWSVVAKIPGVTNFDAWECQIAYQGGAEIDYDFTPSTESSAEMPGVKARYTRDVDFILSYGIDSDGGTAKQNTPSYPLDLLDYDVYRNTPNYVASQHARFRSSGFDEAKVDLAKGTQVGYIEQDVPITGWVRFTAKETITGQNYVSLSHLEYQVISRRWAGDGYYSDYFDGTYENLCEVPTKMEGSSWETFLAHRDVFDFNIAYDVLFMERRKSNNQGNPVTENTQQSGFGGFRHCYAYHPNSSPLPNLENETQDCFDVACFNSQASDTGNVFGYSRFHDPDPDPSTGNLWPPIKSKVGLVCCLAVCCYKTFEPGVLDPCAGRVQKQQEVVEFFDLPTYRAGFTLENEIDLSDACPSPCDPPSDTPSEVYYLKARYEV